LAKNILMATLTTTTALATGENLRKEEAVNPTPREEEVEGIEEAVEGEATFVEIETETMRSSGFL
jgi:hypothetical protein